MGNENSTFYNFLVYKTPIVLEYYVQFLQEKKNVKLFKIDNISVITVKPEGVKPPSKKAILFSHGAQTDIYVTYRYLQHIANLTGLKVICYDDLLIIIELHQ